MRIPGTRRRRAAVPPPVDHGPWCGASTTTATGRPRGAFARMAALVAERQQPAANGADDCNGRTDEGVRNACGGCGDGRPEVCNDADNDCDGPRS